MPGMTRMTYYEFKHSIRYSSSMSFVYFFLSLTVISVQEIRGNKYDLSINRYKEIVHEQQTYEKPEVVIEQILVLDKERNNLMKELADLLNNK